jgi:cell division septation protein DedD
MFFTTAFIALSYSASAFATVYVTSPTASSTFVGGKNSTISWQDDGTSPSLAQFGAASVSIYAGNSQQQTLLQTITPSVNVGTVNAIIFVPDPTIGPNADQYFIRFQSLALKDATNPQYPALAFSAKFTMSGMTGTFSPTVQAQIDGQSTAPIGGSTVSSAPASSAPASSTAAPTTSLPGLITTTSAKPTSSSAKPTTSSSAASPKLATTGGAGIAGLFMLIVALL